MHIFSPSRHSFYLFARGMAGRRPRALSFLWGSRVRCILFLLSFLSTGFSMGFAATPRPSRIRDITEVQGIRGNQLIGYGLVVGLEGTGDRQQTYFTVQTLANMLQRLGVQIPAGTAVVKNVAAVMVTGELPAFSEAGMKMDITVSSVGDAKT